MNSEKNILKLLGLPESTWEFPPKEDKIKNLTALYKEYFIDTDKHQKIDQIIILTHYDTPYSIRIRASEGRSSSESTIRPFMKDSIVLLARTGDITIFNLEEKDYSRKFDLSGFDDYNQAIELMKNIEEFDKKRIERLNYFDII